MHARPPVVSALVVLGAVLLSTGPAGCASVEEEAPPDTVRALRYRRLAYDEFSWHGGEGRPVVEIWFPGRGIVCNVTEAWDHGTAADGTLDLSTHPELHAFFSPILNRYPERFASGTEIESPVEEVRVPRALAERVFRMAELDRELEEGRRSLGAEAVEAGVLEIVKPEKVE